MKSGWMAMILLGCLAVPQWTMAEVIRTFDFEAGLLEPGYPSYFTRGNAQRGDIFSTPDARAGRGGLAIFTPDAWSWSFFVNAFGPGELKGRKLRAGCWMKTNHPETAALIVTEGFVYGEAGVQMKFAYPKQAGQWEYVTVEWEIKDAANERFSVAVGHDYGAEKSWTIIDDLTIECGDELPPLPTHPPQPSNQTDMRVLASLRNVASEVLGNLADLRQNPNLSAAERAALDAQYEQAAFLRRGEFNGVIGLDQVRAVEQFLTAARQWRLGLELCADTMTGLAHDRPVGVDAPATVELAAATGEQVAFWLLLRNRADFSQPVQLEMTGELAGTVTMRRCVEISGAPDYLPELAANDALSLGGGQTTAVLITCDTAGLAAGERHGVLRVKPCDTALDIREMPVRLQVYPVELAAQMPIQLFNWDYNSANDATPERLQELLDARVNFFNIDHLDENTDQPDFSVVTRWVENFRRIAGPDYRFQLQLETTLPRLHGGWRPEFNRWLDALVAATEQAGLTYDDWNLHIYDETLSDEFLDAARQVKAHNPRVRIFSDKAEVNPERMREFAPYVDYWCPLVPTLADANYAASYRTMRESGHPMMVYLCEPTPTSSLADYRLMPWRAWRHQLQGYGHWAFIPNRQRQDGGGSNFGFFYRDSTGMAPSRRWLEWREGGEDYLLLDAAARHSPELRALADQAALAVCDAAEAGAPVGELLLQWRRRLLEELTRI